MVSVAVCELAGMDTCLRCGQRSFSSAFHECAFHLRQMKVGKPAIAFNSPEMEGSMSRNNSNKKEVRKQEWQLAELKCIHPFSPVFI